MTPAEQALTAPSPRTSNRRESLQVAAASLAVLAASLWLQPDADGYGTHRQLHLPPCVFRAITGVPCPFCGMTTGFAHMARGELTAAWHANLMAPPAFLLTIALALGALWGGITNRAWLPKMLRSPSFSKVLLAVILLFWIANIVLQYAPRLY